MGGLFVVALTISCCLFSCVMLEEGMEGGYFVVTLTTSCYYKLHFFMLAA